jgi:hypothetical protein
MAKVNLPETYQWQGQTYGPGVGIEIPDGLAEALGLSPKAKSTQEVESTPPDENNAKQSPEQIEGEDAEAPPPPDDNPTKKRTR